MKIRLAIAALACFACGSCSKLWLRCERVGDAPEKAQQLAIKKLIGQAQAADDPTVIKYRDDAHFRQMNPDCCSVEADRGSLWRDESGEVRILYRRQVDGPQPYYVNYVTVGPCVDWMEESGHPLSQSDYDTYRKARRA